jgi:DNA-binding GntR family transcriptional regulator
MAFCCHHCFLFIVLVALVEMVPRRLVLRRNDRKAAMAPLSNLARKPIEDETLALDIKIDRRRQVGDQIYVALKQAIIALKLPPGSAISENRICRHIGVSRTPVREAIIRLVEDELIEVFPQQGSFVAPIKLGPTRESHFVRKALELAVIKEAAARWNEEASAQAHDIILRQQRAVLTSDEDDFHQLDELFHENFARSALLAGVWGTIQTAKARVDRVHRLAAIKGRLPVVIEEHRAVLAALDKGDADAAADRLDYHLDRILVILEQLVDLHGAYFVG